MSTAGRINKSGQRFAPKRKAPVAPTAPSSQSHREGSAASSTAGPTPRTAAVALPALEPLGEEGPDGLVQSASPGSAAAPSSEAAGAKTSPKRTQGSLLFGPSDPTASSSQPASSLASSSTFAFAPSDPFASASALTQATSLAPSQPSQPRKSPLRAPAALPAVASSSPQWNGTTFAPLATPPTTTTTTAGAGASSSPLRPPAPLSPTRGTAFAPLAAPPTESPERRAREEREGRAAGSASASPTSPHAQALSTKSQAPAAAKAKGKRKALSPAKGTDAPLPVPALASSSPRRAQMSALPAVDSEEEQEAEVPAALPEVKGRVPKVAQAVAAAVRKGKGRAVQAEDDTEDAAGEDNDDEMAPPLTAARKKAPARAKRSLPSPKAMPAAKAKKAPAARKGKGKAKAVSPVPSDEEDEADEAAMEALDARMAKRQRARKARKGKADAFLFGSEDDEDNAEAAVGEDAPASGDDDVDDVLDEDEDGAALSKKKTKGGKKAGAKAKAPPVELPAVDPSETLMADLASVRPKLSIGRPSERTLFFEQKSLDRKAALKEKRRRMKLKAKGVWNSDDERDAQGADGDPAAREASATPAPAPAEGNAAALPEMEVDEDDAASIAQAGTSVAGGDEDGTVRGDGYNDDDEGGEANDDFVETQYAPQMRIIDGQLVIDESSLQINRGGDEQLGPREVIEESAQDRFVNSNSYGKRKTVARWTKVETEIFFDAISQFGTDFEMIAALFPSRSRREIRNKFNKEDKRDPNYITSLMYKRKPVDVDAYAKATGQDLSGPIPEDPMDAINRRRAEIEADGGTHDGAAGTHGRKRRSKKEEADDAPGAGGGKRRKKGRHDEAAGAAIMEEGRPDSDDEELRRMRDEMEEEERQRRIDEMEAAMAEAA
ncbi:hypothetical protein JCM3770_002352 [Rhodotorula araucariae]